MLLEQQRVEINSLKNLYTAMIMGGVEPTDGIYKKTTIHNDRIEILKQYLSRNSLETSFIFHISEQSTEQVTEIYFEETTLFRTLYKEWIEKGTKLAYVSPAQLNRNVLNIWVALYSKKVKRKIYIPCNHFKEAARNTFTVVFNELLNMRLLQNGSHFIITNYIQWFTQAYQYQRPIYEINLFVTRNSEDELRVAKQDIDLQMGNLL